MKAHPLFLWLLILLGLVCVVEAQDFVPGEIMIDIKHEYLPIAPSANGSGVIETGLPSIDSLNILYGVYAFQTPVNTSSEVSRGFFFLKFPDSLDVQRLIASYRADIHVTKASLNWIPHPDVTPGDYYFYQQWGLSKMKFPDAWRYTNGLPTVVIDIIDGGTDYGHPDLVKNVWQNLGEDADADGRTIEWDANQNRWVLDPGDLSDEVDNDDNGYRNDLVGWDFWNEGDADPQPSNEPWNEWRDHGDKTAGTAAAVTHNRISLDEATWIAYTDTNSVAGASWFSRIMIGRIFDNQDAINAIDYAIDNGARIISMSWSDTADNALLHDKIDEAWEAGLLLIASAGNDYGEVIKYPAVYSNVLAVAATDQNDVKTDYSNYGAWVDLCAAGFNVAPSRASRWSYYYYDFSFQGTSTSCPFVAGVAALVWSCSLSATNAEVRNALESTADDICSLPGNQGQPWCAPFNKLGHGRVNALEAVKVFRPVPFPPGDCNHTFYIDEGDAIYLLNYLFQGGPQADPVCIADTNADGRVNLSDALVILAYLFRDDPPPQDGCI
jgi:subtilisin family serine protease